MRSGAPSYEAALGKMLGVGDEVILHSGPEGSTIELPCGFRKEPHTATFAIGRSYLPPEIVKKKMQQANWGIGRRLLCPYHNPTKRNIKRLARAIMDPLQEIREMAGTAEPAAANDAAPLAPTSEEAREARRLATMLIDEKFDVAKGCYRDGYTDRKIADECGVSEHFVTKRREEDFGPLKTPPEIAQAQDEIERMEQTVAQLRQHCLTVCDNLDKDIGAHRARLAQLVRANSWNT